jgi:hypothetical protein
MFLQIAAGAWVSGKQYGFWRTSAQPVIGSEPPELNALESVILDVPPRYGRFNQFTRLGFLAVALTFKEAGLPICPNGSKCGLVFSTRYEAFESDVDFYRSSLEEGGAYASANLFPYTLPVLVAGECAAFFKIKGTTFSVGDNGRLGEKAIECAAVMLENGPETSVLTGWVECPRPNEEHTKSGAIFVWLEKLQDPQTNDRLVLRANKGTLHNAATGKKINSLIDLFCLRDQRRLSLRTTL